MFPRRAGALWPWMAILVKAPPDPLKMPDVALPPVTFARNAAVPLSFSAGVRKVKNPPVPVPGALCPCSAMLVRLPPEPLKMPSVAVPPVTPAVNATVPASFSAQNRRAL